MRTTRYFFGMIGVACFLLSYQHTKAQDSSAVEKKTPDLAFVVKKLTPGSFLLQARLTWYENRTDYPVADVPVLLTIGAEGKDQIAIPARTDEKGYAEALLEPGAKLPHNKDGSILIKAVFAGSNEVEAAEAELSFTEVKLVLELQLLDSVKTTLVKAFKLDGKGGETPLEGESVNISVQRMFSTLPVGDISIDAEGNGSLEFPADLPGEDSLGSLEIIAAISESDTYGNTEVRQQIAWGLPKPVPINSNRTLWSHIAPVWMIISLTIMLIGVWAHYLYVIIQLIRIKRKGRMEIIEK